MDQSNIDKFRQEIVDRIEEITLNGDISPSVRAGALMQLIRQRQVGTEVFSKTYEAIGGIEDDEEKLGAYLDLLFEVDSTYYSGDSDTTDNESGDTEVAEPEVENES